MHELLTGVVVPAVVTAVVLLPALGALRRGAARWVGAAAVGLGFTAGFFACSGWAPYPPTEHWRWIAAMALLAALAAGVQSASAIPRIGRVLTVLAAIVVFGWLVVPGFPDLAAVRLGWRIAAAFALLVLWVAPAWVSRDLGSRTTALILWLHAAGLAGFLVAAHTARLAQLAGVSAACMGVFVLLALWRPAWPLPQSILPLGCTIALGLALLAYFYDASGTGQTPYLLAGIAPITLAVGRVLRVERLGGWRSGLINIVLLLIPLGVAIALVLRADAATPGGGDYEGYY